MNANENINSVFDESEFDQYSNGHSPQKLYTFYIVRSIGLTYKLCTTERFGMKLVHCGTRLLMVN